MCDHTNAQTVVGELLHYLEKADYSIRETLVSSLLIYGLCVIASLCNTVVGYMCVLIMTSRVLLSIKH